MVTLVGVLAQQARLGWWVESLKPKILPLKMGHPKRTFHVPTIDVFRGGFVSFRIYCKYGKLDTFFALICRIILLLLQSSRALEA